MVKAYVYYLHAYEGEPIEVEEHEVEDMDTMEAYLQHELEGSLVRENQTEDVHIYRQYFWDDTTRLILVSIFPPPENSSLYELHPVL